VSSVLSLALPPSYTLCKDGVKRYRPLKILSTSKYPIDNRNAMVTLTAMTLDDWLKKEGNSPGKLAEMTKLSEATISRLRNGLSWPRRKNVELIERATKGAVSVEDFYRN
jgi:hypothetical protein